VFLSLRLAEMALVRAASACILFVISCLPFVSGIPACYIQNKWITTGTNISSTNAAISSSCQSLCQSEPTCTVWSWQPPQECKLWSATTAASDVVGAVSGPQTCGIQVDGSGTTNPSKFFWQIMEMMRVRSAKDFRLTYRAVGSGTGQKEFSQKTLLD